MRQYRFYPLRYRGHVCGIPVWADGDRCVVAQHDVLHPLVCLLREFGADTRITAYIDPPHYIAVPWVAFTQEEVTPVDAGGVRITRDRRHCWREDAMRREYEIPREVWHQ